MNESAVVEIVDVVDRQSKNLSVGVVDGRSDERAIPIGRSMTIAVELVGDKVGVGELALASV